MIESLSREGAKPVDAASIADRVRRGEVIVVRGLLQSLGWFERLIQICREELEGLVGEAGAAEILEHGFERLHTQLSPEALVSFNCDVMRRLPPLAPHMIKAFARQTLGRRDAFAELMPNFRTIVPHDVAVERRALLLEDERHRGAGKLTLHPPHHDSWHGHPLGTINLWCAIGPVRDGNGMMVFPDAWGARLPTGPDGALRRDQQVGRPLNFTLAPGDGLVFHANHLHGSEVNRTDATRTVISLRFTLGAPDFPAAHVFPYVYADWAGTALKRWARLPVLASPNYLAGRAKAVAARLRGLRPLPPGLRPQARFPATHDSSSAQAEPLAASWEPGREVCRIAADALDIGEVRPLDARFCVFRTAQGYAAVSRSCPHEGADLAGGWVRDDGQLACPWHNLTFDPTTGRSPCRSIRPLRLAHGVERDGQVRFVLTKAVGAPS